MNIYRVTNDQYSNEEVTATMQSLQSDFDELGWDVRLVDRMGTLVNDKNGDVVGERVDEEAKT